MNSLVDFLIEKFPILLEKLVEQIYLTVAAIIIATLISVPVGIWIVRKIKIRNYALGAISILQTIPSLAVLGFLLPFFGIGVKTAIVTLVLYTLLPILRNTVTGLENVSPSIIEAADGLGFTRFQKLRLVELPIALPVIVAGIRTATAMGVGIATLATFVGAGGLGDFIYEGLSLNNSRLIMLGAIPAALLALILDYLIAQIEKSLTTKINPTRVKIFFFGLGAGFILAILFFAWQLFQMIKEEHNTIRIGTKDFSEQFILGELMTQLLQAKTTLHVIKKFNLGGTFVCHHALLRGDIDLYPEYTGTAYRVILKQSENLDAKAMYEQVKATYLQQYNLSWLHIFGFDNSNAIVVRQEYAVKNKLNTISDLVPLASALTIGVPADFMERPDGFPGLRAKYNIHFGHVRLMDPGITYKAIAEKQIDVMMAFSTDGRIPAYHLVILKDDRHLFPPYYAAPVVRNKTLQEHPEIQEVLSVLLGRIDNKTMQRLNYEVDVLKQTPTEVAHHFLVQNHLVN